MEKIGAESISEALRRVGELLDAAGETYAVVILGGAALNLLGIVERGTADVDILAFALPPTHLGTDAGGLPDATADDALEPTALYEPPEPMPAALVDAIREVARDMGLDEKWMNTGPALQLRAGLPPGLARRVHWRQYAALWVGLTDRYDLIFFKLFAAADSTGTGSVHYKDLLALNPTEAELSEAAAWVHTQDASSQFADVLDMVVQHVRAALALGTTPSA